MAVEKGALSCFKPNAFHVSAVGNLPLQTNSNSPWELMKEILITLILIEMLQFLQIVFV